MAKTGYVVDADTYYLTVAVFRKKACGECHPCEKCMECGKATLRMVHNDCAAKERDLVKLSSFGSRLFLYSFFVFIFPLLPAGAAFILVKSATDGLALPFLAMAGTLGVFYLGMRISVDRRREKHCLSRASHVLKQREDR